MLLVTNTQGGNNINGLTNLSGRVGSVSTALHTGSQVFINLSKPKEGSRSKIRGAKPRQLVCKQVILAVSMSVSPAEIIAKSTRTLSSCGPKINQISLHDAKANERDRKDQRLSRITPSKISSA